MIVRRAGWDPPGEATHQPLRRGTGVVHRQRRVDSCQQYGRHHDLSFQLFKTGFPPLSMPTPSPNAPLAGCATRENLRLTRDHFRFLSGSVQGLDARALWDRYLFALGSADLRRIRSVTAALHDQLGALARHAGRPEIATLLRRRSASGAATGPARTLDEFSATLAADMHSQAELLALWNEAHGEPHRQRSAQRRHRLVERQLAALRWLESLAVTSPKPDDPVSAWLAPQVACRLRAIGIVKLADLQRWIDLHGHHWHRHVPRLGAVGAARIVGWLVGHADTLGALPVHASAPLSQLDKQALSPAPSIGVVPLERLRLPPGLSGVQGTNRAEAHADRTTAIDDLEAVRTWLSLQASTTHTWRAYRREAERFLLWAVFERGKALSSLDGIDCMAFHDFLAAPGDPWLCPRHVPRWSTRWRPLEAGLSPSSIATAVTIVKGLCGWLVRQRYLDAHPWSDVPRIHPAAAAPKPPQRSLSVRDWESLQQWLTSRPPGPSVDRLQVLLSFAYRTGLRESELANATVGWLRRTQQADGPTWSLAVAGGPGRSPRTVELPEAVAAQLLKHLANTALSANDAAPDADRPLFAHRVDPGTALKPGRIYTLLKAALGRCADTLEPGDTASAARIRAASTHWLRHTHAMHAVADGTPLKVLQHRLGHRSPTTTAIYLCGRQGA